MKYSIQCTLYLFFRKSIKTYDHLITLYVKPHAWSTIVANYRHILSLALDLIHRFLYSSHKMCLYFYYRIIHNALFYFTRYASFVYFV